MQDAKKMQDRLINDFADNYMEKLFYFCLKKTGCQMDAEDLTQDIAMNIIIALNNGTIPSHFSAWVWQIARNRYAAWANKKHLHNESVTGADIGDYEVEDESQNILEEMIHTEQLAFLRRELAFIKSEYRHIIVAYYLENTSIRDIASSHALSQNAVKQRLFRARQILKEGMDMAREFGVRSYKPEEIDFSCSCDSFGKFGQPWNVLSRAMYKNIFLEAYGNPSTAEELSVELGVALPYMEDDLEYLTSQTFLIKKGDKYETSFPIVSKSAQEKIWDYNANVIGKITELFTKLIDNFTKVCEAHGIDYYGKYQTYEDAKWTLLMRTFDKIKWSVTSGEDYPYTKRPDGGNWDIVGYQKAEIANLPWVGLHGCLKEYDDRPAVYFQQFKFKHGDICAKTPDYLSHTESLTLRTVAEGKWEECDEYWLLRLLDYGYIRKNKSGYDPAIIVFDGWSSEDYLHCFTQEERNEIQQTVAELRRIMRDTVSFAYQITAADLPASIAEKENLCSFACQNNTIDRCDILEQALKNGWIRYDDSTSKVIGAYMYI